MKEIKSKAGLSKALIQTLLKKTATFHPQATGPAAASQSKKGQNKTKRTSCVSVQQDGNQTERMTKERTWSEYKLFFFDIYHTY